MFCSFAATMWPSMAQRTSAFSPTWAIHGARMKTKESGYSLIAGMMAWAVKLSIWRP